MPVTISTSAAARRFAERLQQEIPPTDPASESCKESCEDRSTSKCAGRSPLPSNFGHDNSEELELFNRSVPEKYRACTLLREEGKKAFTEQKYKLASAFYEKILIQLDYTFTDDVEWKSKFRELQLSSHMNLALSRFRLGEYRKAIFHCNQVLSLEKCHVKALVRRGLCHVSLCEYSQAEKDFTKVLEIDTENVTARDHLVVIEKMRQDNRNSERKLYTAMFGNNASGAS
ncbi:peptidyl-prolyl cis-trans isomerase, putative [Babesia ovis]|uniref:peptidylprolyl isomerase n=1 Tax=Babesia ovis TaxID=5869 RepID=A0A9W5TAB2_BABOV|nr:peptidyl-prolyl cis-trans isomerase, putative [Babesia ovis]